MVTHSSENAHFLQQLRGGGGFRAITELKDAGVTRAIGLGVNEADAIVECLDDADFDWCLMANQFTLLEQPSTEAVFEETSRRGVRLIAAGVLSSSVLAGGDRFRYGDVPEDVARKVADLQKLAGEFGTPLQAVALQFVEGSKRYASMLLGPRTVAELDELLEWRRTPVPGELWSELARRGLVDDRWLPQASLEGSR